MSPFLSILKAEIYKTLRYKELYIFIFLPIITVFLGYASWEGKTYEQYLSAVHSFKDKNPWIRYYQSIYVFSGVFYTLMIVAFTYITIDKEHTAKAWRYYFSLPYMDKYFLWIKQLVIAIATFIMLQVHYIIIMIGGFITAHLNQGVPFNEFSPLYGFMWLVHFKFFVASLPIIAFQVWFNALVEKKILITIFLPIASWLTFFAYLPHNTIVWSFVRTFNFKFQKVTFVENFQLFNAIEIFALICLLIISGIGYFISPKIIHKLA